jgi:protease IV
MNNDDPPFGPGSAAASAAARTASSALGPGIESSLERVALELLRDRRSERRWRLFFRLSWLLLALLLLWALFGHGRFKGQSVSAPHTALVEVFGEIAPDMEANADALSAALRSAFEDSGSVAVVLRFDSPGGSPVQAGILADEIRRLKTLHGKKVYAVVEDMCASAAYYIASAADEIYVDKASLVGSIGVLMDGFGFTGTMEKLGVERRLITAGSNKGMLDPFSPLNEAHKAHAQATLDQVHQQFIRTVKQNRGSRLKETPEMFSGLYWNGEQAVKMGLADRLGSLDFVAREVVKAEEVVDYTPRDNVAERLAKRFGAAVGGGVVRALQWGGTMR